MSLRTESFGAEGDAGRVPPTEVAVLFVAALVALTALLPAVAEYRPGVVLSAGLLVLFAALWFHLLPRDLFGGSHFAAGTTVTVAVAALLLELSGGVRSPYFGVYLLSVLGSIYALRPAVTVVTGVGAMVGYAIIAVDDLVREGVAIGDEVAIPLITLAATTFFAATVARTLRRSNDALIRRSEVLADAAVTDPLTGLRNRAVLDEHLALMHALAERTGRPYALVAADVDNLKGINDTHGHAAGDAALVAVARAVRASIRATDVGVRTGGDEFLVLLPDSGLEAALVVAERLRAALRARPATGSEVAVTVSIGVAAWRAGRELDVVRRAADAMLYAAKAAGRDRVVGEAAEAAPPLA